MPVAINRSQFLRGDFQGNQTPLRPPWAVSEGRFIKNCTRCHACIQHCPQSILKEGAGRLPEVDFSRGECTFCGACVEHCEHPALQHRDGGIPPWTLRASINNACLARDGVFCVACKEQCEAGAIVFHNGARAIPLPEIQAEHCTGCGACYHPCPTRAIELQPTREAQQA